MFINNLNRRTKTRFYLLKPLLSLTNCLKSLIILISYYSKANSLKHVYKLVLTSLLPLKKAIFLTYLKNKYILRKYIFFGIYSINNVLKVINLLLYIKLKNLTFTKFYRLTLALLAPAANPVKLSSLNSSNSPVRIY